MSTCNTILVSASSVLTRCRRLRVYIYVREYTGANVLLRARGYERSELLLRYESVSETFVFDSSILLDRSEVINVCVLHASERERW